MRCNCAQCHCSEYLSHAVCTGQTITSASVMTICCALHAKYICRTLRRGFRAVTNHNKCLSKLLMVVNTRVEPSPI